MPVYDYKCATHGVFHELATMEQSASPANCPHCRQLSPRILMIPPEFLTMPKAKKQAIQRSEESRHSPIISSIDSRAEQADRRAFMQKKQGKKHAHSSSCGCGSNSPDKSSLRQQAVYLPDGSKVFPSQRPWMISH